MNTRDTMTRRQQVGERQYCYSILFIVACLLVHTTVIRGHQ